MYYVKQHQGEQQIKLIMVICLQNLILKGTCIYWK